MNLNVQTRYVYKDIDRLGMSALRKLWCQCMRGSL